MSKQLINKDKKGEYKIYKASLTQRIKELINQFCQPDEICQKMSDMESEYYLVNPKNDKPPNITAIKIEYDSILSTYSSSEGVNIDEARDHIKKKYEYLYQKNISKGKLDQAHKNLDSIVKLEGLSKPVTTKLEADVTSSIDLTNLSDSDLNKILNKLDS